MSLRDSLTQQTVAALPLLEPLEIGPTSDVREAIALMQDHAQGCIIVTEHCRPIGVFTERDVLTKVLANDVSGSTPIVDVMTGDPQTVQEGDSVASVMGRMNAGGFRHIPVVDSAGHLKSVISIKRIVEYLVEHFPRLVFNLPPDPGQRQTAREGA